MPEEKIKIELDEEEARLFIVLRKIRFFELQDTDIIFHKNKEAVLTDIKQSKIKPKEKFNFIWKRKKDLTECLAP